MLCRLVYFVFYDPLCLLFSFVCVGDVFLCDVVVIVCTCFVWCLYLFFMLVMLVLIALFSIR